jgi:hypothetical protein
MKFGIGEGLDYAAVPGLMLALPYTILRQVADPNADSFSDGLTFDNVLLVYAAVSLFYLGIRYRAV